MKIFYKFLFLLIVVQSNLAFGQQEEGFVIKVKARAVNNRGQIEKSVEPLLKKYHGKRIEPRYPNAKNPELCLFYNIRGKGNAEAAVADLRNSNIFESVVKEDSVFILGCVNPLPQVNDSYINDNLSRYWSMDLIEANCAWSISKGNPNILIGIADTDFEETHEDLINQIAVLSGPISNNHQHGTWVCGMASAETNNNKGIAGIGYHSKISARRIPHAPTGGADPSELCAAIWNLYQSGVRIINVSWSGTGLDPAAAQEITENGTVLVLSAGNQPYNTHHNSIANIPGVILVSGVDENNQHGPTGHAHNQWVDICAPSFQVVSTSENNLYGRGNGTSLAAPMVAGTLALILEVNPCLTPAEIEDLIKNSADPIDDATNYPGLLGAGRLNAYKTLVNAMNSGAVFNSDQIFSGSQNFSANSSFSAGGKVTSGANVNFTAGKEVELRPGFEVELNSYLEVDNQYACPFVSSPVEGPCPCCE